MRTVFVFALLLAGCSCSDPVDPFADGSVPLDGTAIDGGSALGDGDVAIDGGTADCAEYARVICASAERCYLETIWVLGSVERCEAYMRGECEYTRSLPGVAPGRVDALIACYEDDVGCDAWRADTWCEPPAGSRSDGEPCRWDLQCAEGLICAGGAPAGRLACDTGICRVPLGVGTTDCWNRDDGNRCAPGLRCERSDGASECVPYALPAAGEPCLDTGECGAGLYCNTSEWTCQAQLGNGAPCEPPVHVADGIGPCGGTATFECDPETRTCVQLERAFVGDPCSDDGPRCSLMGACIDGICTSMWSAPGEACETSNDCLGYACVDGVCAPAPCDGGE